MSLLGGLKNIVNGVTLTNRQTGDDKVKIISELKNKKEIKDNLLLLHVLSSYQKFDEIQFGMESTTTDGDVYRDFGINGSEVVIAVVKGKKGLLGRYGTKVVVTNQALYCLPENEKHCYIEGQNLTNNRILLSDICKYIVCSSKNKDHVWVEGYEGKYDLIKKSAISAVVSQNSEEQSLVFFLELIINFEVENNNSARQNRNRLCDWLIEKTMAEKMRTGKTEIVTEMLNSMKREKEYVCKLYSLLLKVALYSYDDEKISSIIEEVKGNIAEDNRENMLIVFEEDVRSFAKNLSDINIEYSRTFLNSIRQDFSLSSIPETLFDMNIIGKDYEDKFKQKVFEIYYTNKYKIGLHILLRKDPSLDIDDVAESLRRFEIGEDKIKRTLNFQMRLRNQMMKEVFEITRAGNKIQNDSLKYVDGFGLNPLHYSILMKNDELIKYYIKKAKNLTNIFESANERLSDLLAYGTLLMYFGKEEYVDKAIETSPEIKELLRYKKQCNLKLSFHRVVLSGLQSNLNVKEIQYKEVRSSLDKYSGDYIDNLFDEIERIKDEIEAEKDVIESYRDEVRELENEIEEMELYEKKRCKRACERLRNDNSFEVVFYKEILSNTELLYNELCMKSSDYDIYEFFMVYVFMSKDMFEKTSQNSTGYEELEKCLETEDELEFVKPYGEHWFSDKAYSDMDVMKKEYRVLASKYHPDNNQNSSREFLDIQKERNLILEQQK